MKNQTFHTIKKYKPDEVYNLAAQSFVGSSFDLPIVTSDSTAIGTTRLLEAIRKSSKKIKFYQASSSEMFGKVVGLPNRKNPILSKKPICCIKGLFSYDDNKL